MLTYTDHLLIRNLHTIKVYELWFEHLISEIHYKTNIGQTDRYCATKLGNGLHHNSIKRVSSWMMYARQTARAIPNCSFYRVYNGLNHFLSTVISITSNVC